MLSKCFPRLNVWITEQLLQDEVRTNDRIRAEFERATRLRRQRDGEVTGYAIKTKIHYKASDEQDDMRQNVGVVSEDVSPSKCESSNMCTICLLELEDGDCIADLGCGHFYHAECLGEWILKKVFLIYFHVLSVCVACHSG